MNRKQEKVVQVIQRMKQRKTANGFKCQVTTHCKMYYCWMWSYSKPILSEEQEQTMVITAQSCAEMACTHQFITPQGHKQRL